MVFFRQLIIIIPRLSPPRHCFLGVRYTECDNSSLSKIHIDYASYFSHGFSDERLFFPSSLKPLSTGNFFIAGLRPRYASGNWSNGVANRRIYIARRIDCSAASLGQLVCFTCPSINVYIKTAAQKCVCFLKFISRIIDH